MAGAFDALGAAAAIAQFIEYAVNLGQKAVEAYRSPEGVVDELFQIEKMGMSLRTLCEYMMDQTAQNLTASDPVSRGFGKLAKSCSETATELLAFIDDHRVPMKSKMKSLLVSYKFSRNQDKVRSYRKRIEGLRQELHDQLLVAINNGQSGLATTLNNMDRQSRRMEIRLTDVLHQNHQALLDILKGSTPTDALTSTLETLHREGPKVARQQEILKTLWFDYMSTRAGRIVDAHSSTYSWVFKTTPIGAADPVRFISWLQSDSGLYWITGKAGSGKSTLMKYISRNKKTETALRKWAAGRQLYFGTHYFWNPGTAMQKSQQGLLQTLLYEIFQKCPNLIEQICPERFANSLLASKPWTQTELAVSINALGAQSTLLSSQQACFCFFIDGLDEYEGDHEDIVHQILALAKATNIKVCSSSRPWQVFLDLLIPEIGNHGRLDVHKHTRDDIGNVVRTELGPHVLKRSDETAEMNGLIVELCDKAQGVFLWVSLVVKELIKGFRAADSVSTLRKRLEIIPPGLEQYFDHIFQGLDPFYQRATARTFRACVEAPEPLPLICFDLFDLDDPEKYVLAVSGDEEPDWHAPELLERLRKKVDGRCRDLLEVQEVTEGDDQLSRVHFLHRTVRDFLLNEDMASMLNRRAGPHFDPQKLLCVIYVCLVKRLSHRPADGNAGLCRARTFAWHALCCACSSENITKEAPLDLLAELDATMAAVDPRKTRHWTNNITTLSRSAEQYFGERGQRDFTGHLIELGFTESVISRLDHDRATITRKNGRPYLDYASRALYPCFRHHFRQDAGGGINLDNLKWSIDLLGSGLHGSLRATEFLLAQGCSPNEKVHIYGGQTVWQLHLEWLYRNRAGDVPSDITWLFIEYGAVRVKGVYVENDQPGATAKYGEAVITQKLVSMLDVLQAVYGDFEATEMENAVLRNSSSSWTSYLKWW
ncbi:hypothetical protein EJ03DRAFT_181768 [Teratosphaeria nubilosa]|uniref:Uncharacterized protein n=1 Tax=Teratosphaeria nubilosa TaxID=161662 RepID=A0A6G1L0H8_9PEZI|nr:hypothetical protein EJ03DRAFT_181768 [Teratosphaeria nubilosa]